MGGTMRNFIHRLEEVTAEVNALEANRAQTTTFMEGCPAACFIKDAETGRYSYINDAWRQLIREDAIGKLDTDLFPLETAKKLVGHDLTVLTKGERLLVVEPLPLGGEIVVFLLLKFLIQNGKKAIGGLAIQMPNSFQITAEEKP